VHSGSPSQILQRATRLRQAAPEACGKTAPALAAAMRRANRGDLARLKHLLEATV
jgi:hypothetical protein